jgi:WD40 repeat protein
MPGDMTERHSTGYAALAPGGPPRRGGPQEGGIRPSTPARWVMKAGYLIAAFCAVAVWLFANTAAYILIVASLLPFQIFPGLGSSLFAIIIVAFGATFIINRLRGRLSSGGYVALLIGVVAVSSLLVYSSLVGVYAALDESPPQRVKLEGKYSHAYSVWFSTDGRALVGQGRESVHPVVRHWDAQTGELRRATRLVSDGYLSLEGAVFSPDGQTLAVPDNVKKAVMLWNVATGNLRFGAMALGEQCCVGGIRTVFSPDGRTLATASEGADRGSAVTLWDARTGELKRTLPGELAAFSPDGGALAVYDRRIHEAIRVWDAQTLELKLVLPVGRSSHAIVLVFSPDGKTLVSNSPFSATGKKPDIGVWDLHTGRFEPKLRERRPTMLAFSPDGRLLALNDGHMLEVYDARSWGRLGRFQPYESSRTVSGSGRRGDPIRSRFHTTWPRTIAFSPDGKTLATTCNVGIVKLWDVSESWGRAAKN